MKRYDLRGIIVKNYYAGTDEILTEFGKMHIADERFKKNINKYGEGTAGGFSGACCL